MSANAFGGARRAVQVLTLAVMAGAGASRAHAASNFPDIPVWAEVGAWHDSSLVSRNRCVGSFQGPLADSLGASTLTGSAARAVTVRFLRDRVTEARPDFGGYRVYRMTNTLDSSRAVLIRRFSLNNGSEVTWNFSRLNPVTMNYICNGSVVHDSIVTFVDPDSNGQYQKVCRHAVNGVCVPRGDSILVLVAPPGPHDGFLTWYSVTIERKNTTDPDYEDLFVPDPAHCTDPQNPATCQNVNNKLHNLAGPVEPTGGPTPNTERVLVVPNPYRGSEVWDRPGQGEVHFINLPAQSRIRIYTAAGDLVRELEHSDTVRDFERWDLKNSAGQLVASGIYMYRVEAGSFHFQNRLVLIR